MVVKRECILINKRHNEIRGMRRVKVHEKGSAFFLLVMFLFAISSHLVPDSVFAATFSVNSISDGVDANPGDGICATVEGFCTLRAAIMEANSLAGADTITLPAGVYTLAIAGADEDASATGDLDIIEDITINGAGSATTTIDGNSLDRVIDIHSGAVTISGVTIRGGNPGTGRPGGGIMVSTTIAGSLTILNSTISENRAANGGGIYNPGLGLTITNSSIDNNIADVDGGGITNFGFLVMQNSTISNNTATSEAGLSHMGTNAASIINSTISGNIATTGGGGGLVINTFGISTIASTSIVNNTAALGGGGLYISGTGPVTVANSTISSNTTNCCVAGGILHSGSGELILRNSTVSGNTVSNGDAGGIFVSGAGPLTATNTTVSNNIAGNNGGGIFNYGLLTLTNVTLSRNEASIGGGIYNFTLTGSSILRNTILDNNAGGNCNATITSAGHNLDSGNSCGFSGPNDLIDTNPLLGPLSNNGGSTLTHALLAGSPAIDAADPTTFPATDQRGVTRPQGAGPDIGAYELVPSTATTVSIPTMTEWGLLIFSVFAGFLSMHHLRKNRLTE